MRAIYDDFPAGVDFEIESYEMCRAPGVLTAHGLHYRAGDFDGLGIATLISGTRERRGQQKNQRD
jgi:hypothetical protein